ncbi:hypothetical protein [Cellulomonas sp. S1-8]|uniref:hypothetical protein n=1 Tax=Cellulomonas sp. S1-8 TaxID=2904790 RepID=UPI0022434F5F|nr:hypothetical protein [Cellulomonas sp. S1-8]UZN03054.1 hypothetical protein OKX07_18690 [Cellulomonas sp. S1-8]
MQQVLYTTRWNRLTRKPTLGHSWLTEEDARRRYDNGEGLEIVDAAVRDADGTPRPVWFVGAYGRFRVQLFLPGGSVARNVDWDLVEGRLWRWVTTEYLYPDEDTQHPMSEATTVVETTTRHDGTASVTVSDESGQTHATQFADVATDGYWLDVPVFGEWGPIVNATLGATPGAPA